MPKLAVCNLPNLHPQTAANQFGAAARTNAPPTPLHPLPPKPTLCNIQMSAQRYSMSVIETVGPPGGVTALLLNKPRSLQKDPEKGCYPAYRTMSVVLLLIDSADSLSVPRQFEGGYLQEESAIVTNKDKMQRENINI
ncbi:unnamed protein product [Pleuronectes platessa]|uniref:Uncharacterized protein n=1 Tax=Pleuronectes platessa TaxID=8262 RepID=A0A9N7U8C5_PLEPL|nr:unnamed protein product [Pleuronectes platessa]